MEQNVRIASLVSRMTEEFDAVLITSDVDRLYFTGMQSSAGTLLVTREAAYLVIDFRYVEKARQVVKGCEVILQERLYEQLLELCKKHNVKSLGIESEYLTVSDYLGYNEKLPDIGFVMNDSLSRIIRELRMTKSPEEIKHIRAAQAITDAAFSHICEYIQPGMTDRQIAGELLDFCYRNGSERPAFDFIVVSGAHSSMPHGVPTGKVVEPGDFITMDFGCVVNGYCSDMTRTVAVGQVSDEQRRIYEIVGAAQKAAMSAVKPGASCAAVDAAARDLIAGAGYGACFGHSTGHSLGLEIHEQPAFAPRSQAFCAPGMVITVEPGIYLEGRFGVRTENIVLVTEDGYMDLTASGSELVVL
ncbi:aminopeptidase P family protein [Anaerotruncus sp. AF02-27]|uniref:M24 family metallopeptidase n=1 Tax=Anaerotruncus TaxID=244127 RepID=UPI000E477BC5|nr:MULTISPECIES: Xaa-Pro peptidase family protein [Anaerotruncus]RGX56454.1 aminopeptidase P family protein [Anaerotruncus sp. AF02-27]